ncbi:MAG: ribosome biogenesis GTPase YlqF [Clostridia bacterium]|nr:ribosome biogenesis GTPase YlqF [Clostridia bacterium]
MQIQWYPGHMTKTRRYIEKNISLVDLVIEVADARVVNSSRNPDFDRLLAGKKRLTVLTKRDLADEKINKAWEAHFKAIGQPVLFLNTTTGQGVSDVLPTVRSILSEQLERAKAKGMTKTIRLMMCGVPNSGKSTLINALCKRRAADAQDRPGVTRGGQWYTLQKDVELLDTPGILWNKFEDMQVGIHLALTGAVSDEVVDREGLALELIEILQEKYPRQLEERYRLPDIEGWAPLDVYEEICRKRGFLLRGNDYDYTRCAAVLLDEFRGGKIGRISLEEPNAEV